MKNHGELSHTNMMINCIICGKLTHSEIGGRSGLDMCRACIEECEAENEHNDYHIEPVAGCKYCEAEARQ